MKDGNGINVYPANNPHIIIRPLLHNNLKLPDVYVGGGYTEQRISILHPYPCLLSNGHPYIFSFIFMEIFFPSLFSPLFMVLCMYA